MKSVDFPHGGGGSGPNPHFYKSVEGFFLAHFCLFLTIFDHKISGNFPHSRGDGGGSVRCGTNPYFFL